MLSVSWNCTKSGLWEGEAADKLSHCHHLQWMFWHKATITLAAWTSTTYHGCSGLSTLYLLHFSCQSSSFSSSYCLLWCYLFINKEWSWKQLTTTTSGREPWKLSQLSGLLKPGYGMVGKLLHQAYIDLCLLFPVSLSLFYMSLFVYPSLPLPLSRGLYLAQSLPLSHSLAF